MIDEGFGEFGPNGLEDPWGDRSRLRQNVQAAGLCKQQIVGDRRRKEFRKEKQGV
jgi:hypothetical protein